MESSSSIGTGGIRWPAGWPPSSASAASTGRACSARWGSPSPKNAIFPPFVTDIDSALKSIDVAYHMNHALDGLPMFSPTPTGTMLEGIGHYGYMRVPGKKQIIAECTNPYPCPFNLGLIQAMAQRFESTATVIHDPTRPCRESRAARAAPTS